MKKTDSPTAYYTNSEPKCITAITMILHSSVTLADKINNATPDALLFPEGKGIFNRQFTSLMSMTNFFNWNQIELPGKNAKLNSVSRI
jgi:hypothetical protein